MLLRPEIRLQNQFRRFDFAIKVAFNLKLEIDEGMGNL